jgi:hypothetical protein
MLSAERNLHERRLEAARTPEDENASDLRRRRAFAKTNPLLRQVRQNKGVALAGEHRASVRRQSIFGRTQLADVSRPKRRHVRDLSSVDGVDVLLLPTEASAAAKNLACAGSVRRRGCGEWRK